jgi:lactoylglutathione lyase
LNTQNYQFMFSLSFNHVAISVKNVDISIAFYKKIFRLEEIENTASTSKTRWLSLGNGHQLHLIPRPHLDVKTHKAVHFALSTSNIKEWLEHLQTLAIPYEDWLGTANKNYVRNDGIQQFYIQDPDGYWVEINNDV